MDSVSEWVDASVMQARCQESGKARLGEGRGDTNLCRKLRGVKVSRV